MTEIIPSVLTADPVKLKNRLDQAQGVVERVSLDIIDGRFADNKTIDPSVLNDSEYDLRFDYQLMVVEPADYNIRYICKPVNDTVTLVIMANYMALNIWVPKWLFELTAKFIFPSYIKDLEKYLRKKSNQN